MSPHLLVDQTKIREFCQKWGIVEFSLFGSVLRDDFRKDSDVDVLVEFKKEAAWDLFDLVSMRDELQMIFGRQIDLVEKDAIRNPFRRREILAHHEVLYAA